MTSRLHDPLPDHGRVAVVGLGRSGKAALRLLQRFGKEVLASDAGDLDLEGLQEEFPGVEFTLNTHNFGDAQVVVLSPGIEPKSETIRIAKERGVILLSELELGYRATQTPIIAITGTDGKTTTTMLTQHILAQSGIPSAVAGNIGIPLSEVLLEGPEVQWLVVEVSAFQLLHSPTFAPEVLIATNIAEDHMDYFSGDWSAYVAAKRAPVRVMGPNTTLVLNADHPEVKRWSTGFEGRVWWYGADEGDAKKLQAILREDAIDLEVDHHQLNIPVGQTSLSGQHNFFNAMGAGLGALAAGADLASFAPALASFKLAPHRIEHVVTHRGIRFINDSKATNAHAATAGLLAVPAPLILIAGGVDKNLQLEEWVKAFEDRVEACVVIGDLRDRLIATISSLFPSLRAFRADSMEEAVERSYALAQARQVDTVLLSPGCSSFDMFNSYKHRGEVFRAAALALEAAQKE